METPILCCLLCSSEVLTGSDTSYTWPREVLSEKCGGSFPFMKTYNSESQVMWATCPVLVCSSWYNKILQTWWFINRRNSLLTVLEDGSPRTGCQHGGVRALFQGTDFLCPHIGERKLGSSQDLITSQRSFFPIPCPLGTGISTYEFGGGGGKYSDYRMPRVS